MASQFDDAHLQETLARALGDPENYHVPLGVSRYDYGNTHGWWARITRDGVPFNRFFSDGHSGSIAEALKSALIHRHEVISSFPETLKRIHAKALPLEPEKRVRLCEQKGKNQPYVFWEARWYDENHKVRTKNFSVQSYGHDQAKELALETARKNHNKKPKLSAIPDLQKNQRWKTYARADIDVLSTINSRTYAAGEVAQRFIELNPHGFEGERKFALHQSIERDKQLCQSKIDQFVEKYGKIYCELCKFSFKETYPFLEKDTIEVHHIVPLAKLTGATKVRLSDLMLLCSNCHLAIHQGDAEENLLIAMEKVRGERWAS